MKVTFYEISYFAFNFDQKSTSYFSKMISYELIFNWNRIPTFEGVLVLQKIIIFWPKSVCNDIFQGSYHFISILADEGDINKCLRCNGKVFEAERMASNKSVFHKVSILFLYSI